MDRNNSSVFTVNSMWKVVEISNSDERC